MAPPKGWTITGQASQVDELSWLHGWISVESGEVSGRMQETWLQGAGGTKPISKGLHKHRPEPKVEHRLPCM